MRLNVVVVAVRRCLSCATAVNCLQPSSRQVSLLPFTPFIIHSLLQAFICDRPL